LLLYVSLMWLSDVLLGAAMLYVFLCVYGLKVW